MFNLRGTAFSVSSVYLEDPATKESGCELDGLRLDNCNAKEVPKV